jgi:hypothetical protein
MRETIRTNGLATSIALSGLSLLILYPIGMFSTGTPFLLAFLLHLCIHLYAIGESFQKIWEDFKGNRYTHTAFLLGILLPLALLVILSAAPVTARDALIHHLAVPNMWIQHGSISETPWHTWSYYPMLLQLGFAGFLKLGAANLTSIYHGSFLILLAGAVLQATTPLKQSIRILTANDLLYSSPSLPASEVLRMWISHLLCTE